jgi:hypothetical protein
MSQLSHPAVDIHRIRVIGEAVLDAAHRACADNDMARSAATLDQAFGPEGRHLSESQLRVCLKQRERNYARLEWAPLLVALPGSEVLPLLATAAGYTLQKKQPVNDAQFRERARSVLLSRLGPLGLELLEELER